MQQYEEMLQPEPPKPTQLAKALFDFQGQSDKEISFEKVLLVQFLSQSDLLYMYRIIECLPFLHCATLTPCTVNLLPIYTCT